MDGKPSNDMDKAEWTFTKDAVTFKKPGREISVGTATTGQPMMKKTPDLESQGTYHIDPSKNPREIDLTMSPDGTEHKSPAIYILEEDKLTLGIPVKKDAARPLSWSESGIGVFKLHRVK
jgi:uncharacterized protein (TIGR03067 family)